MWWLDAYDLIFGFTVGVWLTRNYFMPVLPIKVTKLPDDQSKPFRKWSDMVDPIVGKLIVGGTFGNGVTFNETGSKALGGLIKDMGTRLDTAVRLSLADEPTKEVWVKKIEPEG